MNSFTPNKRKSDRTRQFFFLIVRKLLSKGDAGKKNNEQSYEREREKEKGLPGRIFVRRLLVVLFSFFLLLFRF